MKIPVPTEPNRPGIAFTDGAFFRESVEDQGWYLQELAQVFEAKTIPENAVRWNRIGFMIAILGVGHSRRGSLNEPYASFRSHPPGDWVVLKGFIGDDSSEFYLNLNPKLGFGEFSIKDEAYGDRLLSEFAKILLRS